MLQVSYCNNIKLICNDCNGLFTVLRKKMYWYWLIVIAIYHGYVDTALVHENKWEVQFVKF